MNITDLIVKVATGVGGLGGLAALILAVFSRRKTNADAEDTESGTWRSEAAFTLNEVKAQYVDCKKELARNKSEHHTEIEAMRREHSREIGVIRRELADVRDALISRADVVDELLPYVQGLPEDKMREMRAANRVVRQAAYRGY